MPVNLSIPFGSKKQPMFNSNSDASRKTALVKLTASYWPRLRCLRSHRCSDRSHDNHKTIQQQWLARSFVPIQVAVCHPRIWLLSGRADLCQVGGCRSSRHRHQQSIHWTEAPRALARSGSSNQNYQTHMHMQPAG